MSRASDSKYLVRAASALRGALGAGLAALIVAAPAIAQACAVCVDPEAENRTAFIITTVLLSALPLLLVGGMIAWLWRRSVQLRAEEELGPDQLGRVSSPLAPAGSSRSASSR